MDNQNFYDCEGLFCHTVPILDYDRREPTLIGTGVFVAISPKQFVLTAAHVLESRTKKLAFGALRPDGRFELFGSNEMLILTARAQSGTGNAQLAVYKDGLDLAVIEPTERVLEALRSHYRPFEFRRKSGDPLSDWGVVSGWPARKNTFNRRMKRCEFDTCYHIEMPVLDKNNVAKIGWDTNVFLALSCDKSRDFVSAQDGKRVHLPKLEGVSGGGMWQKSTPTTPWSLGGIVVEDHPEKRVLKVIKSVHIWTAVDRFLQGPPKSNKAS